MGSPAILLDVRDGIALITVAREKHRNALDDDAVEELSNVFRGLGRRHGLRAAVLTGAGDRSFCAGYDLSAIDPDQPVDRPLPDERFARTTQAVLASPVPVVAALQGGAWGGGLDLALACDFRVAHPDAKVAMTPCRLGLVYRWQGLQRFAARIGVQATRRLFLLAEPIPASEALRLGIVDALDPQPRARALAWAGAIAGNAPLAVAGVRSTLAALEVDPSLGEPHTLARLEEQRRGAFASADLRRGLEAALHRATPAFEGD